MNRLAMVLSVVLAAAGPAPAPAEPSCAQRILVLSAFPAEMDALVAEATITRTIVRDGHAYYRAGLAGHEVILTLTGIGLVNAERTTRRALQLFRCQDGAPEIGAVVFSGVSGGATSIGDVAVPGRWSTDGERWHPVDAEMLAVAERVAEDVRLAREVPAGDPACAGADPRAAHVVTLDHAPRIIVGGDGRSADPFGGRSFPCVQGGGDVFQCRPCRASHQGVPDPAGFASGVVPFLDPGFFAGYMSSPPATTGADADDMETAAVARVAEEHGLPFIAFRALSDGAGDPLMLPGFPFQFFAYRQLAADNAAAVALAFLREWKPA